MTSASVEKWRPFSCFFNRVGLRTYQHPCKMTATFLRTSCCRSCSYLLNLTALGMFLPFEVLTSLNYCYKFLVAMSCDKVSIRLTRVSRRLLHYYLCKKQPIFLNEDRHLPEDIASFIPERVCSVFIYICVRLVT